MESICATTTNAAAATDVVQQDTETYDATAGDATTGDSDTTTATDGHECDADAPYQLRFKHNNRCRASTKTGKITMEADR